MDKEPRTSSAPIVKNLTLNDGWPEKFILFPYLCKVVEALGRFTAFCALEPKDVQSTHYHGAEAMLEALQPTLFDGHSDLYKEWVAEGHHSVAADKLYSENLSGFGYIEGTEY